MLKSYLLSVLGKSGNRLIYSAINILGLAIGLASVILLFLFIRVETSYDRHFANEDRIYRFSVEIDLGDNGAPRYPAGNVVPAASRLLADFPEQIEQTARIWGQRVRLEYDNQTSYEDEFRWADQSFFELFDFQWLAGDPQTALLDPFSVVLTQSTAEKYFADEDPIGKTLTLESKWDLRVTGIIEDLPERTHLSAGAFASMDSGFAFLGYDYANNWSFNVFNTYALFKPGIAIDSIEDQMEEFVSRHKRTGDIAYDMTAMKLTDIHLRSNRQSEFKTPGSMSTIYTFSAIAICLLIIACFNFINLATARAAHRTREIGVRKTIGASREQIAGRFLAESITMTAIAMIFALVSVELLLPAYSTFLATEIEFDYMRDPILALELLGFTLLIGLLAGSYPALYLSGFQPVRIFRGNFSMGGHGDRSRGVLVTLQFAVSIVLVIATAVVIRQIQFALQIERGFKTENILVLRGSPTEGLGPNWNELKASLLESTSITHVSSGSIRGVSSGWSVRAEGNVESRFMDLKRIDYNFFETYDIPIIAGRNFSLERGTDQFIVPTAERLRPSAGIILNRQAANELGWTPEQALGKQFEIDFSSDFSRAVVGQIVGVAENVLTSSAKNKLEPVAYIAPGPTWGTISQSFTRATVRLAGTDITQTLSHIESVWQRFNSNQPFDSQFLESDYSSLYRGEERQAEVFAYFSTLAIFVACLGILGLACSMAEARTKEIGVRKILGSTVWGIIQLFTAKFGKLILFANLLAWPVAYYFMQRWLANFSYRAELDIVIFLGSSALTGLMIWITIVAVSARAASVNPVLTLRYE